ncbi:DUF4249 family protein [Prevotella sp. 10(H)]|uniref:DUF4249 family protein n=1 Tax=Prevotella sp. 10(H) TaxID=1158294 RepID=UPI0004A6CF30|nr:DUF4249 family protein [Prevotella sp. 10(H)]
MNNIYKVLRLPAAIMLFLFTAYSCEKEIDVDLRSVPPRIQIEGMVPQNTLAKVRISHTIDFDDNSGYPFLKGAIVKISDDAGNSEILEQDATGWYVAETLKGVEGRTYNMSVLYEGIEYTATSRMPSQVKLDSVTTYKILAMDYAIPMIHFKDPVGKEHENYRCLLFINGEQRSDIDEITVSTEFTDGNTMHLPLPVFSDKDDDDIIKQDDELTIEFQCLDKPSYTFFFNLSEISNSLNNPTSNIKGGALGVFYAYSFDRKSVIAKWEE